VATLPAYARIADELREMIRDGTYAPGTRLPTIGELSRLHHVSDIVIRNAFAVLRTEGLIETRRGGGTVVREHPPVRRVAMDRYRVETHPGTEPATSFTRDQNIGWHQYRLDRSYSQRPADEDLASLFGLAPGTLLLRRRFVFWARGDPQQLSVNYLPWALVAGTPVADPAREPWPGGTPAQLASLGHRATRVEESVRSRMPTPDEAMTLHIAAGVPVLAITRRMLSGDRVLEVCRDIVIPADRVILDYAIDL
jgi:GntR family transcriptional regulator